MGYQVAESLKAVNCKAALVMALQHLDKRQGKYLFHHSARGIQYCSREYVETLESYHGQISMTENGVPLEYPGPDADIVYWSIAERVNGILKNEYLTHQSVHSLLQAQLVLQQAVFVYNYKRPHLSCDMLPPEQAHQQEGKLKRRWKNYYPQKQPSLLGDNQNQD